MRWVAYFDASALVKRYAEEAGTPLVNEIFHTLPRTAIACSVIAISEITASLVRKKNDGRIQERYFKEAGSRLHHEFIQDSEVLVTSVQDHLILASLPLIEQYNINATDALILRSVLDIIEGLRDQGQDLFFVTSDKRLIRAIEAEGISVCDPEVASLADVQRIVAQPPRDEGELGRDDTH
ncbi:MAG: type II toxin-antitoxin system VapC family toxin [bacterium]|nr:type II toxin-antitoxin system VapC family toxin [bacterium]